MTTRTQYQYFKIQKIHEEDWNTGEKKKKDNENKYLVWIS